MTPEEIRKKQDEWLAAQPKWGHQDANGVDRGHIRENLKLSYDERVKRHDKSLLVLLEFKRAAYDAGLRRDP